MISVVEVGLNDRPVISSIARKTWSKTYADILSQEQIEYMLEMMYSDEALKKQMEESNHYFILVKNDSTNQNMGFASYELNYNESNKTKIHKLYVLPECQGMGLGKILIKKIVEVAKANNSHHLSLNMNRNNKAQAFYKYMGFEIVGEEDIHIGHGYLMEDYILEKTI